MAFAISVEVAFSKDFHDAAGLGFRCVCRWNDKEGHSHRHENTFHCWAPGESVPKIQKDHRFVFCDLKRHPVRDVPGILADLVVFELFPVNKQGNLVGDSFRVTKCGVYVINDAADSSSLKMPPPVSSLDAVELSDDEVKAGLHEKNKAVFVYIACLFNDEKVDSLGPLLASIDLGVCSGLSILAAWSLIHISSKGEIVMHLSQRQFCRDIVHRQSKLPVSSKDVMGLSHNWDYDAFVSFNGQDVRREVISQFLKICQYKEIRTFKESEILNSRKSSQAISGSRIAVVVFSENYTSSTRCLNELVEIMKCREELGQVVMPLFYNVDPSDVRDFGKRFRRTCKNNIDDEQQRWSRALTDAASIGGGESSLNWYIFLIHYFS